VVKLRLRREGKKGHAIFKIVATDERSPRDGAFLEIVGQYDPNLRPATITVKETRVEHWLKKGAQPTDTVRSLLRRTGFWLRWTLMRQGKDEATVAKVTERWQLQQADRQTRDTDRKARRADRKKKAAQPAEVPAAPAAS
jgi:small subunit ribosomal protein S16